jgi:hypothetical protein
VCRDVRYDGVFWNLLSKMNVHRFYVDSGTKEVLAVIDALEAPVYM